nr:hypothetical protein BaRGS_029359 [Batillaria attramentaria]
MAVRPSEDTEPVVPVLSPWPCEQRTAFLVKDKFEYFKPCVQVEKEQPEQPTSGVTAVYIRGWKVDMRIMEILRSCFIHLEKLHTINMWNVGLTSESVNFLTCMLPLCPNLKSIVLDANPVDKQNYSQLIQGGTVQHLSLRHCRITDEGACRLGHEVGSLKSTNTSLLSLDLAGNLITDEGAAHLSKALRTNRTLLTLSLANNKIGDRGATMLAEVLARFPLTHEECLERRYRRGKRAPAAAFPN